MRRRGARAGAAVDAVLALLAAAAVAQHPLPQTVRPFHARAAEADAAALVRVEAVDEGRLQVSTLELLHGALPERFAVKRSPLRPPPLAAGDVALLLLAGARPPYVLQDEPREIVRLESEAEATRWAGSLRTAMAPDAPPRARATAYAAWIDEGPEPLREVGLPSLLDLASGNDALRQAVARERAGAAADVALPAAAREASALLAVLAPEGAARLLAAVPGEEPLPQVVLLALRGAATHRLPGATEAFERALGASDPGVRRAALQSLPTLTSAAGSVDAGRVRELAHGDPDPAVRRQAERALRILELGGAASRAGE